MMRRAVFLLAAVCAAAVLAAPTAGAKTPPPPDNDAYNATCSGLTVSNTSPAPGEVVTVSGHAAGANATIAIVLNNSTLLGTTTSDANGNFSTSVQIPADAPAGGNTIQAFEVGDNTDPLTGCPAQVAALEITAGGGPVVSGEPQAVTGSNSTMPLVRLAFGLLAAGGLAMLVSRRRKATISANA
jgi:hypothetical protein